MTKNFSQKGFTANFLTFMKDLERNRLCCLDFLTRIFTEDSSTVTFTGTGTKSDPLIATAVGSGGEPAGSSFDVQFNLGGAFAANTGIFTYNPSDNAFSTGPFTANNEVLAFNGVNDTLQIGSGNFIWNNSNSTGTDALNMGGGVLQYTANNDNLRIGGESFRYANSDEVFTVTQRLQYTNDNTNDNFAINNGLTYSGSHFNVTTLSFGQIIELTNQAATIQLDNDGAHIANGNLSIGSVFAATAQLHVAASSGVAGTAPIKLTGGTLLTIPEDGAIEYNGSHFFLTTGANRFQIDNPIINGTTQQANANFNISGGGVFGNTTTISKNNTGVDATSHLVINGTWNTTGAPTLISANITNTASAGAILLDLRANNTGRFRVFASGAMTVASNSTYFQTNPISVAAGGNSGSAGQSTCVGILNTYAQATGAVQQNALGIQDTVSATGGSSDSVAVYVSTSVNQTGTATGNVRGFYYQPNISAILGRNIAWQNVTGDALFGTTSGDVSIGRSFANTPSARLHVGGSTAGAAGSASIKLDHGTLLTVPEDGTLEYDGTHLYFTIGVTRTQIL